MAAPEQIVEPVRREREVIADFQLPIDDLIRAAQVNSTVGVAFEMLSRVAAEGL